MKRKLELSEDERFFLPFAETLFDECLFRVPQIFFRALIAPSQEISLDTTRAVPRGARKDSKITVMPKVGIAREGLLIRIQTATDKGSKWLEEVRVKTAGRAKTRWEKKKVLLTSRDPPSFPDSGVHALPSGPGVACSP